MNFEEKQYNLRKKVENALGNNLEIMKYSRKILHKTKTCN